jgi:peptidyl-tRNA hydrolase
MADGTATDTAPSASALNPSSDSPSSTSAADSILVQYVVMRSDLIKAFKWNIGGLIANGCHASIAVIADHLNDADVRAYIGLAGDEGQRTQMHKVVLAVKDEAELRDTAALLSRHSIDHRLWVEAPEELPSCLATRPYRRSVVQPLLRHLKLFR